MISSFTPAERRTLSSLDSPVKVQKFLDKLPFHHADSAFSPRKVLRHRTAHCLEGALLAASAFRFQGRQPLVLDLEAVNDTDHVIAVFQNGKAWGAVGSSNFAGLRYRPPIYRTLRELAISYFEDYINLRGERTLRTYSKPVNLSRFDKKGWETCEDDLWYIVDHLLEIPHIDLLTPKMESALTRVDQRSFASVTHGMSTKKA